MEDRILQWLHTVQTEAARQHPDLIVMPARRVGLTALAAELERSSNEFVRKELRHRRLGMRQTRGMIELERARRRGIVRQAS